MDKLFNELPNRERVIAVLDAMKKDDGELAQNLFDSAPTKSYSAVDMAITETVGAAQDVSMRFDRYFYKAMYEINRALAIKILVSHKSEKHKGKTKKEMLQREDVWDDHAQYYINQLYILILGTEAFSRRVGLSFERLLAFSKAMDDDEETINNFIDAPDSTKDEHSENIGGMADAFEELWKRNQWALEGIEETPKVA